jgi:hypothetical protein
MLSRIRAARWAAAAVAFLSLSLPLHAAPLNIPPPPAIGSTSPVQADLLVVRPTSTPCTVPLFTQQGFNDFNDKSFQYTPPAGCPGPYSKIIFSSDFSVTAGRQFDRTLFVAIGGINVFFGTTQEPSAAVSPAWHVERDITDYAAALAAPQAGFASLGNLVDSTYTGLITGSGSLLFYPADANNPAAKVPDTVLPLSSDAVSLASSTDQLSQTFTLPTNGERVYLDVIAQSQASDEFWWTCAPSDIASEVENCGNSGFRETEVSIDGTPAGVAPIYPWVYTGGIDPRLWRPTVGVQTLNFVPYRVDLTPFAGLLANGAAHTIALSVFNAQDHFATTATLLIFRDPGAATVTGSVISNTLSAAPVPVVTENLTTADDGSITGPVSVTSTRDFAIAGTLQTSHGTVVTTVAQTINFSNVQNYTITDSVYGQTIAQSTSIISITTAVAPDATTAVESSLQWPISLNYTYTVNADGSSAQTSQIDQAYTSNIANRPNGVAGYSSSLNDHVISADTLLFDSSGNSVGSNTGSGSQQYQFSDTDGSCYDRTVSASAGAVTAVNDVCAKSVPTPAAPSGPLNAGDSGGAFDPELLAVLSLLLLIQLRRQQYSGIKVRDRPRQR